MKIENLYTLIMPDGSPVLPFDVNGHKDEGMLVYCSMDAAFSASRHKNKLYGLDCIPVPLSEVKEYTN